MSEREPGYEPWTARPRFVKTLDPQATERLVNELVNELCDEIENLMPSVKSLPPGKHLARKSGELEALLAVIQRMQDHGIISAKREHLYGT